MTKEDRNRRLLEKSKRLPLNNVTLTVQKSTIDINSVFKRIDDRIKEVTKDGQVSS